MKLNKTKKFISVALVVLVLDIVTKFIAAKMKLSVVLIDGFLSLSYVENTGAGFGLLKGQTLFLVLFTLVVLGIILYSLGKIPEKMIVFTAVIFGGALGNLIDRLFYGYVVDFISFSFWPAFNVADIGVTVGVIGLIVMIWRT